MRVNECIRCETFPCADVQHSGHVIPDIEIEPERVSLILISEAAPPRRADFYYAQDNPAFAQTTVQAFQEAGASVATLQDILNLGIYLTTAIKCAKTGYGVQAGTVRACSFILERELALFPHVKAFLLMGDVAIKAVNYVAQRQGQGRVIPAGSTYKIRGQPYFWGERRAFPSYLQVGPSFGIEKSKQQMIAQDIAAALDWLRHT